VVAATNSLRSPSKSIVNRRSNLPGLLLYELKENIVMVWNKKINRLKAGFVGALMVCSLACIGPAVAQAQSDKIGIIDEKKLADGYKVYIDAKRALDERLQNLDAQIPARQYLEEASATKFDSLIKKESLTAIEKTELANLVRAGLDRNNTYIKYTAQPTRTKAEEDELKKIEADMRRNMTGTRALQDELQKIMQDIDEELDKKYTEKALSVIKQIAADKKLAVVLRQMAVVWNLEAIDITQEAINIMNKK